MARQLLVVHFGHGREFLALGDAAGVADVHPQIVDQLLLDQLAKGPLGRQLFAGAQGHVRVGPQGGEGSRVLRADRILHKERTELGDRIAQLDGARRRQPGVHLEDHLDLLSDRLAQPGEMRDAAPDRPPGIEPTAGLAFDPVDG